MNLNLLAKLATATGLNTWPRNSPVFVFPHLTFLKNTDTEGQALQGVTHMRAQDQSPQTQEAAGGRAGAGTECSVGTELQSGKKNKSRKCWR